jgi:hypothetical protein
VAAVLIIFYFSLDFKSDPNKTTKDNVNLYLEKKNHLNMAGINPFPQDFYNINGLSNKPKFATIQSGIPIKQEQFAGAGGDIYNHQNMMTPLGQLPLASNMLGNPLPYPTPQANNLQLNQKINSEPLSLRIGPQSNTNQVPLNQSENTFKSEAKQNEEEPDYDSDLDVFEKEVKKEEPIVEHNEEDPLSSITNESGM